MHKPAHAWKRGATRRKRGANAAQTRRKRGATRRKRGTNAAPHGANAAQRGALTTGNSEFYSIDIFLNKQRKQFVSL